MAAVAAQVPVNALFPDLHGHRRISLFVCHCGFHRPRDSRRPCPSAGNIARSEAILSSNTCVHDRLLPSSCGSRGIQGAGCPSVVHHCLQRRAVSAELSAQTVYHAWNRCCKGTGLYHCAMARQQQGVGVVLIEGRHGMAKPAAWAPRPHTAGTYCVRGARHGFNQ